jgi:inner membrane protein
MFVAVGALLTSGILYVGGWRPGPVEALALCAVIIYVEGWKRGPIEALGVCAVIIYVGGWKPGPVQALALCGVISLLVAIMGRRPLQSFQNSNIREDNSSDLIGHELVTTQEVTKTDGWVEWCGTHWQARLAADAEVDKIGPGVRTRVVQVIELALILRPVS